MGALLVIVILAAVARVEGVLLRRSRSPAWQLLGWCLSLTALCLGIVAMGGWPVWWPVLPVALAGTYWLYRHPWKTPWWLPAAALVDLTMVLVAGRSALPSLAWSVLLPAGLLLPLLASLLDGIVLWMARRIPGAVLAVAGLLPVLGLYALPALHYDLMLVTEYRLGALLPEVARAVLAPRPAPGAAPPGPRFAEPPVVINAAEDSLDAVGKQWAPYFEWRFVNPDHEGNPFDLAGSAIFVHRDSGETHTTGLFYGGDGTWRLRFTATLPGLWTFGTHSPDPHLDGHRGSVQVAPNPGVPGFIRQFGNKWGRTGVERAFVPQLIMAATPDVYHDQPARIQADIHTFMVEHGFNGLHVPVLCRWFHLRRGECSHVHSADPQPDPRTFEALERLITEVHAAGGVVHLWMWGDDSRHQTPQRWGLNGPADRRLQRYLAARLGPLPGWTLGYGYDLFEWVSGEELVAWHEYLHRHLGWRKFLGARASKNQLDQLTEVMDYAAYEQHRPDYALYVRTIEQRPHKPAFSEDRFRRRHQPGTKDYTMQMTRRGLWHSTMAGGVANIWGNLEGAAAFPGEEMTSRPYPDPAVTLTYRRFFQDRFWHDMVRCNELTEGVCLMRPDRRHHLFYREDTDSLVLDLSAMDGAQPAVAVDTRLPYREIALGELSAERHTWTAPYASDWAIAVGPFAVAPGE